MLHSMGPDITAALKTLSITVRVTITVSIRVKVRVLGLMLE